MEFETEITVKIKCEIVETDDGHHDAPQKLKTVEDLEVLVGSNRNGFDLVEHLKETVLNDIVAEALYLCNDR